MVPEVSCKNKHFLFDIFNGNKEEKEIAIKIEKKNKNNNVNLMIFPFFIFKAIYLQPIQIYSEY